MISQMDLHANEQDLWIVDSGCSKHMTRDKKKFIKLEMKKGGSISLDDNTAIKIHGK